MDKPIWDIYRNCKWWQIEPDAKETLALCIDEDLQPYRLREIATRRRFLS